MSRYGLSEDQIKRLISQTAIALAEAGQTPVGGPETVRAYTFTFATPSPVNLDPVQAGAIMDRVSLLITTPFDDPAATVKFGLSGAPSFFLGASDSDVQVAGQYETDQLSVISINEFLRLTISPGASTQGAGIILWKVLS